MSADGRSDQLYVGAAGEIRDGRPSRCTVCQSLTRARGDGRNADERIVLLKCRRGSYLLRLVADASGEERQARTSSSKICSACAVHGRLVEIERRRVLSPLTVIINMRCAQAAQGSRAVADDVADRDTASGRIRFRLWSDGGVACVLLGAAASQRAAVAADVRVPPRQGHAKCAAAGKEDDPGAAWPCVDGARIVCRADDELLRRTSICQ